MANELTINPKTIFTELQKFKPQMEAALPRHMTPDRMARIALTQLRVNPKLFNCTPESFYGSLMAASQLGLEPGIQGQCYLIPYGNVCTLVPGWRGYMDLLSRTGRASAWTNAVYDGDEFDYEYGDKPFIHHKPGKWSGKEAAMEFAYAVGRQKESEWPVIEVWDIGKIQAHRNKNNKVGNRHYSFEHPEMYARKIPLLQVLKYLPSSIELASASALDVAAAEGKQKLTIDMALKNDLESGGDTSEPNPGWPDDKEVDDLIAQLNLPVAQIDLIRREHTSDRDRLIRVLKSKVPIKTETAKGEGQATPADQTGGDFIRNNEEQKTETKPEATEQTKKAGRPKKDTPVVEAVKESEPSKEPEQKAVVQTETKPEVKPEPAKTTQESVSDDLFSKF